MKSSSAEHGAHTSTSFDAVGNIDEASCNVADPGSRRVARTSCELRPPALPGDAVAILVRDGVDDQAGDIVLGIVGQRQVLEHHGRALRVVDRAQDLREVLVGDDTGQPVAGHQQPVARPDVEHPDVFRAAARVLAAQVEIQDILELVVRQLLGGDRAGLEQGVGQRVVLGELLEPAVAEAIGARVADARDVDPIEPELGQDDRRPHVGELGHRPRAAQDLLVDLGDGVADRFLDPAGLGLVRWQPALRSPWGSARPPSGWLARRPAGLPCRRRR